MLSLVCAKASAPSSSPSHRREKKQRERKRSTLLVQIRVLLNRGEEGREGMEGGRSMHGNRKEDSKEYHINKKGREKKNSQT